MKSQGSVKFSFPNAVDESLLTNEKVAIVSFVGKSTLARQGCKATSVDQALGRKVFEPVLGSSLAVGSDGFQIGGYYDKSQHVIYLHLIGAFDTFALLQMCAASAAEIEEKSFLSVWSSMKYNYARAMLFLFSVSHIIVVTNPSLSVDTSYIHLFRSIDNLRLKVQPVISELLRDIPGLPKDWASHARLCSPRVLFLFERGPNHLRNRTNFTTTSGRSRVPQHKKIEHSLEDQIYHILRKSRIVTNISANSLFAVPANLEFVFVCNEQVSADPISFLFRSLADCCEDANPGSFLENKNKGEFDTTLPHQPTSERRFSKFIKQHIDQALGKGFDDNVGRHAGSTFFEVPVAKTWFEACKHLFTFITSDVNNMDSKTKQMFVNLQSSVNTDVRFSESRCGKALPQAVHAYQENLPSHYTQEYHENKLTRAVMMLCLQARGPCCEQYVLQLEEECEKYWLNGHQMCESLSLRGNHCTKPLHQLPQDDDLLKDKDGPVSSNNDTEKSLPVFSHLSGVRYVSTCNCGRKQANREDPFSAKTANYDFYVSLAAECCHQLEKFTFPVFQPSIKEYRAARVSSHETSEDCKLSAEKITREKDSASKGSGTTGTSPTPDQTQELSLGGPSLASDLLPNENSRLSAQAEKAVEKDAQKMIIQVNDCTDSTEKDKWLVRQPSTTEYLPGMLHMGSPAGLLPRFPSWSLVCLGPSSLYSHNVGLQPDQPAFLPQSSFLLPWDVTLKTIAGKDRWQVQPLHPKGRKPRADISEMTVKIFIGVEYECPRGHRFMCSGPDKVLKTTGAGLVKDTANRVASSDMPLYFPCPCKSNNPLVGQLMRIHIVTPKAPVSVTLNPKVQPASAQCPIFVTGTSEPMQLSQSSYWVLRLPYVYVGEQETYIPPKDSNCMSFGRLLKGVYGISPSATEFKVG